MSALGLTPEQAEVVASMLLDVESATEAKCAAAIEARRDRERDGNARRQAAKRARDKEILADADDRSNASHSVTADGSNDSHAVTAVTSVTKVPPPSPQEIYNQPPIHPLQGSSDGREREASAVSLSRQADEFYASYPKHINPSDAKAKFIRVVKSGADGGQIIAAAKRFAEAHRKAGTEKQFIAAPAVWLNKGGYLSEDLPEAAADGPITVSSKSGADPYGPDRSASAASRRQLEAIQRGEDPFDAIKRRYMPDKPGRSDVSSNPALRLLPQIGRSGP